MQIPKGSLFCGSFNMNILTFFLQSTPIGLRTHSLSYINYVQYQIKNPTKYKPIKANPIHAGITGLLTFHEEDDDDFGRPISVLLDIAIARVLESSGVWRLEVWFEYQTLRKRVGLLGRVQLSGPIY